MQCVQGIEQEMRVDLCLQQLKLGFSFLFLLLVHGMQQLLYPIQQVIEVDTQFMNFITSIILHTIHCQIILIQCPHGIQNVMNRVIDAVIYEVGNGSQKDKEDDSICHQHITKIMDFLQHIVFIIQINHIPGRSLNFFIRHIIGMLIDLYGGCL